MTKVAEICVSQKHKKRDVVVTFYYDASVDEWFCEYNGFVLESFSCVGKTYHECLRSAIEKLRAIIRAYEISKNVDKVEFKNAGSNSKRINRTARN